MARLARLRRGRWRPVPRPPAAGRPASIRATSWEACEPSSGRSTSSAPSGRTATRTGSGYRPTTAPTIPFYAKCVELDVPIQIQVGMAFQAGLKSVGWPGSIDTIAVDFPELKIIGIHTGYPWEREMVSVAWKHPNVYIGATATTRATSRPSSSSSSRGRARESACGEPTSPSSSSPTTSPGSTRSASTTRRSACSSETTWRACTGWAQRRADGLAVRDPLGAARRAAVTSERGPPAERPQPADAGVAEGHGHKPQSPGSLAGQRP